MKKFTAILLAGLMLFASGCGDPGTGAAGDEDVVVHQIEDGVVTDGTGQAATGGAAADPLAQYKESQFSDEELAAAAQETIANPVAAAGTYTDVPYATQNEKQVCDIIVPEGEGPFPLIIVVHGGGFALGDRHDAVTKAITDQATAHGYASMNIEYRTVNEATFPGALSDVRAAVRFARAKAGEYNFDTDRIVLWGQSAGGYLAATTALTPDVWEFNADITDNLDQSCAVSAFVDFSGPICFNEIMADFEAAGMQVQQPTDLQMFVSAFLGFDPATDQTRVNQSYWGTYVDRLTGAEELKGWISHGTGDWTVPYPQSVNFADRLKAVLPPEHVSLELYEGATHEADVYYAPENMEKVFLFLEK